MPILLPQDYNPFSQRRFQEPNLFDNGIDLTNPPMSPTMMSPTMPQSQPLDRGQYQEGPMMERYRQFLESGIPNRQDFAPGKMDRLGAILSGVSSGARGGPGFETARNQLERPYNQALMDREMRGKELSEGAKLEYDRSNEGYNRFLEERKVKTGERNAESLALNSSSLSNTRDRRLDLQELIASGKATDEDKQEYKMLQIAAQGENQLAVAGAQGDEARKTENTRQGGRVQLENVRQENRQKILDFKQSNPTHKIVPTKGGNYYAINPNDPTDIQDTGVKTGTLTEEDKAEFGLLDTTTTTAATKVDDDGKATEITRKTTKSRSNASTRITPESPKQMTSPDGKRYDTSAWSESDIAEAKKRGYK